MKTHFFACVFLAAGLSFPMAALAQTGAAAPAPGETRVTVANGRLHHSPKRFETPAFIARIEQARQAKALARQEARTSREHRLAVKDGRVSHVPKAPAVVMATGDQ
jgi:hypothetical protein